MKHIIQAFKYFLYFLFLIGFYILIAIFLSYIPVNKNINDKKDIDIFIMTNGVHTDIVVPYKSDYYDWSNKLDPTMTPGKTIQPLFVAIGWGDKGFYLQTPEWKDLKPSVALKATSGLSSSAMHITFYNYVTEDKDCVKISVSKENYKRMCLFIEDTFEKEDDSFISIKTNQNYGLNDVFYEAKGSYSLFYTCNTWANNVLKSGNQKAALFTLFDHGIFFHYRKVK